MPGSGNWVVNGYGATWTCEPVRRACSADWFGVDGEVVQSAEQLRAALARARKATVDGKPYLIDAHRSSEVRLAEFRRLSDAIL
jgi:thiamine pyrophosphate-dependent acetolactate synthase large subunit-like protein